MLLPTPTAQPALHNGRSTARLIPAPNAGGMAVKAEQVRRRLRSDARLVLGAVLRLCAEVRKWGTVNIFHLALIVRDTPHQ